jgi:periplasmic mercuric ion binding protein
MNRIAILALGASLLGVPTLAPTAFAQSATEAPADEAEANFHVENMTCALCPVTVKKAMIAVEGVQSVEIDFPARTAHVVFDPSLTDAAAIAAASEQAGYPAVVQG